MVTAKLICVFVFAYAKSRFSHDETQIKKNRESLQTGSGQVCQFYVLNFIIPVNQKKNSLEPVNTRSPAHSETAESLDLAYRISLTGKAEEQKEGLKRVPSFGGTSELDLTVPDSEFFENSKTYRYLDFSFKEIDTVS